MKNPVDWLRLLILRCSFGSFRSISLSNCLAITSNFWPPQIAGCAIRQALMRKCSEITPLHRYLHSKAEDPEFGDVVSPRRKENLFGSPWFTDQPLSLTLVWIAINNR